LAHLAMPPAPSPAPVDFGLAIAPEEAGDDNMRYDIVRPSIVVRDGLVHFQYTTRLLSDSSLAQEDQFVTAVVDCARRRRADEVGGVFDMRPVAPGTRGALQVARVCTIASMPAPTVAPAFAASVATVAAHEARACRYVRIGTVPVKWQGARLRVLGSINGVPVPMIVDTGASNVMIPNSLIDPLGLPVIEATKGDGYGGGGVSKVSAVRTSRMSIGDVRNVGQLMLVDLDSSNRDVLVGDDFLFEHDLEINDREMAFFSPQDCGDSSLAYWDRLTPYASLEFMDKSNPNPVVRVTINGKALRALVDTGATSSILDLAAARALGVDPRARGVAPFAAGAIGTHSLMVWPPEQFDTFEVGGEIIRHPRLAVADIFGNARRELSFSWLKLRNAPDLILGADFLRAHRLLFAQSQHRMYLSYTGGSVFDAPTVSDMPSPPGVPAAP
jgi:predicted aspartyl protease